MKTKDWILWGFLLVLIIILIHSCNQTNSLEEQLVKINQNNRVLLDSVRLLNTNSGKDVYNTGILISGIKELERLNRELYRELTDQKGRVGQITRILSELKNPTGEISSQTTINYNYLGERVVKTDWGIDTIFSPNNWRNLKGTSIVGLDSAGKVIWNRSFIEEDKIGFDIITGIEKKKDYYEIFVRSNYPGFKPTKIEGAIIPENQLQIQKRGFRPGINFSLGLGMGWNGKNISPILYTGMGIGLNKNFKK
jgi:hypothetical protein